MIAYNTNIQNEIYGGDKMNIAIRYFSRTGNTEKLANAISEAVNVPALKVFEPLTEKADILFLGSAVYAAGIDETVKRFLKNKIGTLVNFSTAALLPSTYAQVKKLAEELGINVSDKEYHCRGEFMVLHKARPNAADCEAAKAFAKSILN